ncbi:hypothetical protein BGX34_000377, partial [Mortierella sp. NVP85]
EQHQQKHSTMNILLCWSPTGSSAVDDEDDQEEDDDEYETAIAAVTVAEGGEWSLAVFVVFVRMVAAVFVVVVGTGGDGAVLAVVVGRDAALVFDVVSWVVSVLG